MRRVHKREGYDVILTLETLTLIVKLWYRLCVKKTTQKSLMFELSDKNLWGLCGIDMTAKIEELPAKKETSGVQPDEFLISDLFLLR